ncbi:DUF4265 domain-containing protein [bacterium]|nr:DUF4265 domain-containing protein [bacterium]
MEQRSGQYTYRVWFGDSTEPNIRMILSEELKQMKCLIEWYSHNLLALSCSEENAQAVADFLNEKQNNGHIRYETGKTV